MNTRQLASLIIHERYGSLYTHLRLGKTTLLYTITILLYTLYYSIPYSIEHFSQIAYNVIWAACVLGSCLRDFSGYT